MRKKTLFALTVFCLLVSSFGFICDDDEEEYAYGRVDHWGSCTLSKVTFAGVTFTNLTYDNTPTQFQ